MASLRSDIKLMRDLPPEPHTNAIAQYVDSLPEDRGILDKIKGNTSLDVGDPNDRPLIVNFVEAISTGQLDEPRVRKLMKRNPLSASVFATAFDEYKKTAGQQKQVKDIYSSAFAQEGEMGERLPDDYQGAISRLNALGPTGVEQASKLAQMQKTLTEKPGGAKGLYGGIRVGVIPGTENLIEYTVNEATGDVVEIGTGKKLVRGRDYEPTIGQTIVPVLGGGLEAFPNRGGVGKPLPSAPTGHSAMPTVAETQQQGQALNANNMAQRMFDLVNTDQVKVGPIEGRKLRAAGYTGVSLTNEDAELLSLEENYSNALLEAMRGAQVGPKEQEMFNKSLPRVDQPKAKFLANLRTTIANINRLNEASSRLRAVPKLSEKEKTDFGKVEEWVRGPDGKLRRK